MSMGSPWHWHRAREVIENEDGLKRETHREGGEYNKSESSAV
jgi:hypothetical protein